MKKTHISILLVSVVALLTHSACAAPATTIDLMAEENSDISCMFIEKYQLLEGCDENNIAGGNVSILITPLDRDWVFWSVFFRKIE